jgi:hypothetical protein
MNGPQYGYQPYQAPREGIVRLAIPSNLTVGRAEFLDVSCADQDQPADH